MSLLFVLHLMRKMYAYSIWLTVVTTKILYSCGKFGNYLELKTDNSWPLGICPQILREKNQLPIRERVVAGCSLMKLINISLAHYPRGKLVNRSHCLSLVGKVLLAGQSHLVHFSLLEF